MKQTNTDHTQTNSTFMSSPSIANVQIPDQSTGIFTAETGQGEATLVVSPSNRISDWFSSENTEVLDSLAHSKNAEGVWTVRYPADRDALDPTFTDYGTYERVTAVGDTTGYEFTCYSTTNYATRRAVTVNWRSDAYYSLNVRFDLMGKVVFDRLTFTRILAEPFR